MNSIDGISFPYVYRGVVWSGPIVKIRPGVTEFHLLATVEYGKRPATFEDPSDLRSYVGETALHVCGFSLQEAIEKAQRMLGSDEPGGGVRTQPWS